MRKLVINRGRWYRGRGPELSRLLRPTDTLMCCLGIYLESCGVPEELLSGAPYPTGSALRQAIPEHARWLLEPEPPDDDKMSDRTLLATTNDAEHVSDRERERIIRRTFAKHGVEVSFVDGPSPTGGTASEGRDAK